MTKRQWARGWSRRLAALVVVAALWLGTMSTVMAHQTAWGQGESEGDDLVISLITFSPGDDIAQWFGHTAVAVRDTRLNESRVYNYGMFSLDGDDLLVHFAMGRLWFWVGSAPKAATIRAYARQDRDVRQIELNLPAYKRLEVAEFLADNVRPENRDYLYHHYDDNCATRVRDVIDLAVDGQLKDAYFDEPGRMTLREHTRRHSQHLAPMDWLLMFLMNSSIDDPSTVWEEMFLPAELEKRVLEFEWEDSSGEVRALSLREHELNRAEDRDPIPQEPTAHWPWWLLIGLAVGAVALLIGWNSRRRPGRWSRIGYGSYHLVVGLFLGLPGLTLGVMAVATDHTVTYWNQNLFWANPATLLVAAVALMVLRGSLRGRRWMVLLWLGLAALALIGVAVNIAGFGLASLYQDTSSAMALMLPIILGAAASAWVVDGHLLREEVGDGGDDEES